MEPVVTMEGFKVLQSPDESRRLVAAYYENIGFHVVKQDSAATSFAKETGIKQVAHIPSPLLKGE